MIKHLGIWLIGSLFMPILVALLNSDFGGLVLFFWPGSLMLLSLGAETQPISNVIYVWSIAIASNIILYLFLGSVFYKLIHYFKNNVQKT